MQILVNHFISLLPINIRGSFINRNPKTLEECELLLSNEFNYAQQLSHKSPMLRDTQQKTLPNIPPSKFPGQSFPQKPFNPREYQHKPSGPNNFSRQNLKNVFETRKQKLTPMSGITKQTIPMSTQTIRQNYNIDETDDSITVEQLIDTERESEIDEDAFLEVENEEDEQNT